MSAEIDKLIGIHEGKIGHVIGMGPSLSPYLEMLQGIDKEEEKIISVNDIDIVTDLSPDYWLFVNPGYSMKDMHSRINKFPDVTALFSDSFDLTDVDVLDSILKVKYYRYDSVHFGSKPNIWHVKGWRLGCQRGWIDCCSKIIDGRLTIQETLERASGYENHYSSGDTCMIHAFAFAVLMKFKEINIYGVDLDYSKGYVNGFMTSEKGGATHGDSFDYWMDRIKSDFYIINESAKKMGITVNFLGGSEPISNIINNGKVPEKVYDKSCKSYD